MTKAKQIIFSSHSLSKCINIWFTINLFNALNLMSRLQLQNDWNHWMSWVDYNNGLQHIEFLQLKL